jgi:hypothetical protein
MARFRKRNSSSSGRAQRRVQSADGKLRFLLTRTAVGVHVDRSYAADTYRAAHAVVFRDPKQFEGFLGLDEQRFEYALVYVDVRRAFDELFELDR